MPVHIYGNVRYFVIVRLILLPFCGTAGANLWDCTLFCKTSLFLLAFHGFCRRQYGTVRYFVTASVFPFAFHGTSGANKYLSHSTLFCYNSCVHFGISRNCQC